MDPNEVAGAGAGAGAGAEAEAVRSETDDERIDRQLAERHSRSVGVIEVKYICSNQKCRAEDKVKFFPHEPRPPMACLVANCWKCGAGRGLDANQSLQQQIGMFPVDDEGKSMVPGLSFAPMPAPRDIHRTGSGPTPLRQVPGMHGSVPKNRR